VFQNSIVIAVFSNENVILLFSGRFKMNLKKGKKTMFGSTGAGMVQVLMALVFVSLVVALVMPASASVPDEIKSKQGNVFATSTSVISRYLPPSAEPNSTLEVTISSSLSSIGLQLVETFPQEFTFINFTYSGATNVDLDRSNNTLTFTVIDLSIPDGFTITYYLKAPSTEGTYQFFGTYQALGGNLTPLGGNDTVVVMAAPQTGETVPDSVNDTLEQLVSKYNPSFDWKTQTPSKNDVTQAVINAVMQYFTTSDDATRQEIVGDVVQLVMLYFSLGS